MPNHAPNTAASADIHYFQQLGQGRFLLPRCQACERHHFYPRVICPHCGADTLQWTEASGRGTVYSNTIVRSKGGDYTVSLIDLDEGPRLMSRVVDMTPDAVHIGMPVQARIDHVDDAPLLVFIPRSEARA